MFQGLEEKILDRFTKNPEPESRHTHQKKGEPQYDLSTLGEVFPGFLEHIKDKTILDFGCGGGYQSAALAMSGAKYVLGLDTSDKSLMYARKLICDLGLIEKVDLLDKMGDQHSGKFDIVISQNSMEHFQEPAQIIREMKSALKPEGQLFVTFGPPWFAPHGSHMNYFLKMPWVNIIFSERAVMNIRKNFRKDGATKYEDVESGLNKMSVKKFERIIAQSGLEMKYKRYDCVKKMSFLGSVPLLRELFINRINCILVKKGRNP